MKDGAERYLHYNQTIKKDVLPKALQILEFGYNYNKKIKELMKVLNNR